METQQKLARLRQFMSENDIPAVVVRRQPNFSWLTGGGRGFIGLASEMACGSLVVTSNKAVLVANNIECGRLVGEELPERAFTYEAVPWTEDGTIPAVFDRLCPDGYQEDGQLGAFFVQERTRLCDEEAERFRELGRDVDRCMLEASRGVAPLISEFEMAGRLSAAMWAKGLEPITMLIAADDRSRRVRHYVPTDARAQNGLICSICARRGGLVASATRMIAFDRSFAADYTRLLEVEAAAFNETVPGKTMGEVFQKICTAYDKIGMPEEWRRHHQGGLTGYLAREIRADKSTGHVVRVGEAYAWNPSCEGAKCEDTVLVTENGLEILTAGGGWPTISVYGYQRPAVLKFYEA